MLLTNRYRKLRGYYHPKTNEMGGYGRSKRLKSKIQNTLRGIAGLKRILKEKLKKNI